MFFKTAKSKSSVAFIPRPSGVVDSFGRPVKIAANLEKLALDPVRNYYLDVWAVSSYEKYGLNENADGFERPELLKGYPTYFGSWACLDHQNEFAHQKIGNNVDAVFTPDDYVRIVMGVDRNLGEQKYPGLEHKIATGAITDTSMGVFARESVCTACLNVASDESEFCDHVRNKRGQVDRHGVVIGELNRGLNFFEQSIITTEGADNNAKILNSFNVRQAIKTAQTGSKSVNAEKLYREITKLVKAASSSEEKMRLVGLIDWICEEL